MNKLSKNVPTDNITELNNLIYVRTKLVRNKVGILLRDLNKIRNTKAGWEMRLQEQINKLKKLLRKEKYTKTQSNGKTEKKKIIMAEKTDNTTERNKPKNIG